MARNFSAGNTADVALIAVDQAPASPSFTAGPSHNGSAITMSIVSPTTDFDGTPLTPNGTGSSGCDELWVCGALYAADGSNPLDGLGGADAVAQHLLHTEVTSPGQNHDVSITAPGAPGGATMKIVIFASDGSDA